MVSSLDGGLEMGGGVGGCESCDDGGLFGFSSHSVLLVVGLEWYRFRLIKCYEGV